MPTDRSPDRAYDIDLLKRSMRWLEEREWEHRRRIRDTERALAEGGRSPVWLATLAADRTALELIGAAADVVQAQVLRQVKVE